MAAKKSTRKKKTVRKTDSRKRLTPAKQKRGLAGAEVLLPLSGPEAAPLVADVRGAGGTAIGAYREPLSGRPILLATLPLAAVTRGRQYRWSRRRGGSMRALGLDAAFR